VKSLALKFVIVGLLWSVALPLAAQPRANNEQLADRIAGSLQALESSGYSTLAISRIKQQSRRTRLDINELIDFTNVKIVRGQRFRVTDRSKLQLILREQRIQLSEFVSPNEYRELGQLLGVDLFVYGTVYDEALILKAIDVQNSSIAWADVFPLGEPREDYQLLTNLSTSMVQSLQRDMDTIMQEKVQRLSFWDVDAPARFSSDEVIDYLTVALTREQNLRLVDRENLQLIYQEQKLNQEIYIDESQARRLGELYGVDGFVYGNISAREDGTYVASMKMMNIFNGVITWADLIKFRAAEDAGVRIENPFNRKIQERLRRNISAGSVAIPGGMFVMGTDDPLYSGADKRMVRVRTYQIDAYEVTNQDYLNFVQATNHRRPVSWDNGVFPAPQADHPVVGVTWEDAKVYCNFMGKRLPTEAEWERAARGTQGRKYPWGPSFGPEFAVTRDSAAQGSVSVFTELRDVTPEGLYHLAGNVREYVADLYRPYNNSVTSASFNNEPERVIRGASWAFGAYEAAGFYRGRTRPNLAWPDVGFRCADDL
jgi:formylglycine-generating enzyme required for sulfatase activity